MEPHQLRTRILAFLLDWEHTGVSDLPNADLIADTLSVSKHDVIDQIDILEVEAAVEVSRTFGDNVVVWITGVGKRMLEQSTRRSKKDALTSGLQSRGSSEMWDLFICHASEDKDVVARPLAEHLKAVGLRVWYDEFTLSLGDSLRESIDYGLTNSRFGVVILSHNFFAKNWPQKELDGLFAKEAQGEKAILPVWHNIDRAGVLKYSPMIADRVAVNTIRGLDVVVSEIMMVIDPGSAYLSNGRYGVVVTPASISLGGGGWAGRSSFTINNKASDPVYSVYIKAIIISDELEASDLKIEPCERSNLARIPVGGGINLDAEVLRVNGHDSKMQKVVFLIISLIGARESKTFVVESTKAIEKSENKLALEVYSFQTEPSTILRKPNGTTALPILFKESIKVSSISLLMSRKE